MKELSKSSRIFLSGGGNEQQSLLLDKQFFNELPKDQQFLYVPVARRGHVHYSTAGLWIQNIIRIHGRGDLKLEIADDLLKYKSGGIKRYSGVYIGGGNTWNLMHELTTSRFSDALTEYVRDGGLVYGGSAGAIVLGKRIDTHDDENKISLQDTSGLSLLDNYSVACHFNDTQDGRFREWSMSNNLPIICLPEEVGLVIENGLARCVGSKPCVVYSSDSTRTEINPGKSFRL